MAVIRRLYYDPHTQWKKILVPPDFSEDSLTALREALRFHQLCQTEVVLLHVTEPAFEGLRIQTSDLHEKSQSEARHQLEGLATTYFGSAESVTTLVKQGRAADVICGAAQALKVGSAAIDRSAAKACVRPGFEEVGSCDANAWLI